MKRDTSPSDCIHWVCGCSSAGGLVGARGFEPPTLRSRTVRATKLRHAPSKISEKS